MIGFQTHWVKYNILLKFISLFFFLLSMISRKCKFTFVGCIMFLPDNTVLESLFMARQQIKRLGNIYLVQKVAEHFPIYRIHEDQDASGTHISKLHILFFHTGGSHRMSSVLTAGQLYMKTIFQLPQFIARVSIILICFPLNTMLFKWRYWEMKSLVSCDDCQAFIWEF